MQVLIIKTSSMGDMIHTLPALTDAAKAIPNIQFDWVSEEGFVEVPRWHKNVDRVIATSLRRWRWHPLRAWKSGELRNFFKQLRAKQYDYVIDAQSSIKSAITSRVARGVHCGMDSQSVREHFAHLAYDKTYYIDRNQHAITRLRQLFARALGYVCPTTPPDADIQSDRLMIPNITVPDRYLVFVHNTSWVTKLWPEQYWMTLIQKTTQAGWPILLPWGNQEEHDRAVRLAQNISTVQVLPRLKLSEIATILVKAKAAVCADTGLAHMAAALNIPAITLYGPTNPDRIGTMGPKQIHFTAKFPCAPCRLRECNYKQPSEQKPACFMTIPPEMVWERLQGLL